MAGWSLGERLSVVCDNAVGRLTQARIARVAWVVAGVALAQASAAADRVYHFIDEHGTPHFSNVPADKRYKPYATIMQDSGSQPSAPAHDAAPHPGVPERAGIPPAHLSSPLPSGPAVVRGPAEEPLSPLEEPQELMPGEPMDPDIDYDPGTPVEVDNPSGAPPEER